MPYLPRESLKPSVDRTMTKREEMIRLLKFHLQRAQNRMKVQGNKHRTKRQLEVDCWVWLKLQPYIHQSIRVHLNDRISAKFYGLFQIEAKIGAVAYKLKLPTSAKIHSVFHVSQLKPFRAQLPTVPHIPD